MRNLAKKIKDLRHGLALRQPEFAKVVGDVDQSTVSRWEAGKQKPRPEQIIRLAEMAGITPQQFLGVPLPGAVPNVMRTVRVTGELQAGAFVESLEWPLEDQYEVPAPPDPEWDDVEIHARVVRGNSMNKFYPDSSVVYVCPTSILGRRPKNGEKVVVQRVSADGCYEVTLKEYVLGDDGKVWLWPRSTDPEHQAPIAYTDAARKIDHVSILGVVIGGIIMEAHRV